MAALLKIRDEFFGTKQADDPAPTELRLASERVTPREIIRQRVFAEVAEINEKRMNLSRDRIKTRSYLIDVEDGSAEDRLNSPKLWNRNRAKLLDAEKEAGKAISAFKANRFVMLFDDRQVDGLEVPLTLTENSEVTFLHLMPLKGG